MNETQDPDSPVVVARFPSTLEANLAVGRLAAEGVDALVEPSSAFDTLSHVQFMVSPGGVGVLVPSSQADRARAVMEALRQERLTSATGEIDTERRSRTTLLLSVFAFLVSFVLPLSPLVFIRIWRVWRDFEVTKSVLPEAAVRRIRLDLVLSIVISAVGCVVAAWALYVIVAGVLRL